MNRILTSTVWCAICLSITQYAHAAECVVGSSSTEIRTQNGNIQVDEISRFGNNAPKGVIVLLHGSAGLLSNVPAPPSFDNLGENALACGGYIVVIPHYFDVSGIRSTLDQSFMRHEAPKWIETIDSVVDYALSKYKLIPLFLYGDSLGGFLAVSVSSHRSDITAISVLSAGVYDKSVSPLHLPPTLIQHGGSDTLVPPSEAKALDALIGSSVQHRLIIYPGLGHNLFFSARTQVTNATRSFFSSIKKK